MNTIAKRRFWTETDDQALAAILELRRLWERGDRSLRRLGFDADLAGDAVDGESLLHSVPGTVC